MCPSGAVFGINCLFQKYPHLYLLFPTFLRALKLYQQRRWEITRMGPFKLVPDSETPCSLQSNMTTIIIIPLVLRCALRPLGRGGRQNLKALLYYTAVCSLPDVYRYFSHGYTQTSVIPYLFKLAGGTSERLADTALHFSFGIACRF